MINVFEMRYFLKKANLDTLEVSKIKDSSPKPPLNPFILDNLFYFKSLHQENNYPESFLKHKKLKKYFNHSQYFFINQLLYNNTYEKVFNKKALLNLENHSIQEITKNNAQGFNISNLKENEKAFIFMTTDLLHKQSISKKAKFLDIVSGELKDIVDYYQKTVYNFYPMNIDNKIINVQYPVCYGFIVIKN